MFTGIQSGSPRGPASLYVSLGFHALLFVWLLYPARPIFVSPSSVARGVRDGAATRLYFPNAQVGGTAGAPLSAKPQLTLRERRRRADAARREELARLAVEARQAEARRGNPTPRYPELLRSGNMEGAVIVRFSTDARARSHRHKLRCRKLREDGSRIAAHAQQFTLESRRGIRIFEPARREECHHAV